MVWHRTADRRVSLCYEEQTVVLLLKLQGGHHTEALSYEESAMSPILEVFHSAAPVPPLEPPI
jgi:hypothetical protein